MTTSIIPFVKMHGLGNDFVIINRLDLQKCNNLQALIQRIIDRHTGIGCDQLIIYDKSLVADFEVWIYNQDGNGAKACGNAVRCLAKLIDSDYGKTKVAFKIADRLVYSEIIAHEHISVNMGKVSFTEPWIPNTHDIWDIAKRYAVEPKEMVCADVGNPHLIIFSTLPNNDKEIIGKNLQRMQLFPDGVNVNFASVKHDKIYLSVWERGTGFTLACGSGACATFAAAQKLGFVNAAAEVIFKLGSLKMKMLNDEVIMTGLATLTAKGEFYYEQ